VVNDYLPRIVGQEMVDRILTMNGRQKPTFSFALYTAPNLLPPTMPVEFSAAAFRFGHTMVRSQYRINTAGIQFPLFGASEAAVRHLGGGRRLSAALVVNWARFFSDLPRPVDLADDRDFPRNHARKIDSHLSEILARLPSQAIPTYGDLGTRSLALRDLRRGVALGLPSGQSVAAAVRDRIGGVEVLSQREIGLDTLGWDGDAPLWFYILKEAETTPNTAGIPGEQLGPIGGRIVAEVILGLLQADDRSYLNVEPGFMPTIDGGPVGAKFTMADLLRLAGVTG
jgi:hypothetical protein